MGSNYDIPGKALPTAFSDYFRVEAVPPEVSR